MKITFGKGQGEVIVGGENLKTGTFYKVIHADNEFYLGSYAVYWHGRVTFFTQNSIRSFEVRFLWACQFQEVEQGEINIKW